MGGGQGRTTALARGSDREDTKLEISLARRRGARGEGSKRAIWEETGRGPALERGKGSGGVRGCGALWGGGGSVPAGEQDNAGAQAEEHSGTRGPQGAENEERMP